MSTVVTTKCDPKNFTVKKNIINRSNSYVLAVFRDGFRKIFGRRFRPRGGKNKN